VTDEWFVYVLDSKVANRTYVGVAKDVDKRLLEHNGNLPNGAKSTRGFRPWIVQKVYGPYSKSEAYKVECAIKKLAGEARFNYNHLP